MPRVFIADVSALPFEDSRLSEYRRRKIAALRTDEQKRRSAGAELLLMHALGAKAPLDYSIGENGKPYFEDGRIHFSLSHSGRFALCATAGSPVGADIEAPRPGMLRLAERFFTADELAQIGSDEDFCRIWVKKESYIKASGSALSALSSFSVLAGIDGYCFAEAELEGYRIAVCEVGSRCELTLTEVKLC